MNLTVKTIVAYCTALCTSLLLLTGFANAAKCENFSSAGEYDNTTICRQIRADNSPFWACKVVGAKQHCVSNCSQLDAFEESCKMNSACEWHPTHITNPCKEKKDGWNPVYPFKYKLKKKPCFCPAK